MDEFGQKAILYTGVTGKEELAGLTLTLRELQKDAAALANTLRTVTAASAQETDALKATAGQYSDKKKQISLTRAEMVPLTANIKDNTAALKAHSEAERDAFRSDQLKRYTEIGKVGLADLTGQLSNARAELTRLGASAMQTNMPFAQFEKTVGPVRARINELEGALKNANVTMMHQGQGWSNLLGRWPAIQGFFSGSSKEARMFSDTMGLLAGNILRLGVTMGALVLAGRAIDRWLHQLTGFARGLLDTGIAAEKAELQFKAFLGTAEAASARVHYLMEYSFKTPFEMGEVIRAGVTLEAFGIGTKENLEIAADAAAAFGISIEEAASALGKLRVGEFERFERFGINRAVIEQQVGRRLRTGTAEELAILWTEALKLLKEKSEDAVADFGRSWQGLTSNLRGQWEVFTQEVADAGALRAWEGALSVALNQMIDFTGEEATARRVAYDIADAMMEVAHWASLVVVQMRQLAPIVERTGKGSMEMALGLADPSKALRGMKDLALAAKGAADLLTGMANVPDNIKALLDAASAAGTLFEGKGAPSIDQLSALTKYLEGKGVDAITANRVAWDYWSKAVKDARYESEETTDVVTKGNKQVKETVDALAEAIAALVKSQEDAILRERAYAAFVLEGDEGRRQELVYWQVKNASLKEAIDYYDKLALFEGRRLSFQEAFPEMIAEAQKPISGGKEGGRRGRYDKEEWEQAKEVWDNWQATYSGLSDEAAEWVSYNERAAEGVVDSMALGADMSGDAWAMFFDRQIDMGQAWKFAMDGLIRGMGATWLNVLAEVAIKQSAMWALEAGAAFWKGNIATGFGLAAKSAGMAALAGGLQGAAKAMVGGAEAGRYEPGTEAGAAISDKKAKGATTRNLLSMAGAAPLTINITQHIEIHGNVFTGNTQEFAEQMNSSLQDLIERGVLQTAA